METETDRQVTTRVLPPAPRVPAVIVGMAPAVNGQRPWDPGTTTAQALAAYCGVLSGDLGRVYGLANLCDAWGRTDQPTRADLKRGAASFLFRPGFRYVLAGTEVVRALGARARPVEVALTMVGWGVPSFTWYVARAGVELAVVPHPSRRNRQLNDEQVAGQLRLFLRAHAWQGRDRADDLWRGEGTPRDAA